MPETAELSPVPLSARLAHIRRRWLGPVAVGLIALYLLLRMIHLFMLFPTRWDMSFPEGAVAARAFEVAAGGSAYTDWREWPHQFAPYGPLTYYPVGWAARLLGEKPEMRTLYLMGRGVSLACFLGILALLVAFARRVGLEPVWGLLALAIFLIWITLIEFCVSFRPDAPRAFFALLALWFTLRAPPRPATAAAALAALYVSMWYKPTSFGALAVVAVWLWQAWGPRRTVAILGGFALAGLVPALLIDRAMNGRLFLNMIDSQDNGFTLWIIKILFLDPSSVITWILYLGLIASLTGWRREQDYARRRLRQALWLALFFSLLFSLKTGADANYYLDTYFLSVLMLVWAIRGLWRGEWPARPWLRECLALIGLAALLGVHLPRELGLHVRTLGRLSRFWQPTEMMNLAAEATGPILATNPCVALCGPRRDTILDHFQYNALQERGRLGTEPLLRRLRDQRFQYVILPPRHVESADPTLAFNAKLYCEEFLPTLDHYYREEARISDLILYLPRSTDGDSR